MYLGRFDEEMVIFFTIVFCFVLLIVRMSIKAKERKDRLDLVHKALDHPSLDEQTRQRIVEALAPRSKWSLAENPDARNVFLRNPVFSLAWIGLFFGVGMILIGDRETVPPGIVIAIVSFAVVTIPFALRELESRKHA